MNWTRAIRWTAIGTATAISCAALGLFLEWYCDQYRRTLMPWNFGVVKSNHLYRSGQMRPEHFEQMLRRHGIKTVFAFNGRQPAEERIAEQLGVRYLYYEMPGDGKGKPPLFHEYLQIMAQPDQRPALVHCAAGTYRTGVAVALFRMFYEGWSLDDSVREMRYYGFTMQPDVIAHVEEVFDTIPSSLRVDQWATNDPHPTIR